MAQYLVGAPRSDVEPFLVFTYIWLKDVEKISKKLSAPHNVNPARAITWLVGVTIYSIVPLLNNNPSTPLQFFRGKAVLKKKLGGVSARNTNY